MNRGEAKFSSQQAKLQQSSEKDRDRVDKVRGKTAITINICFFVSFHSRNSMCKTWGKLFTEKIAFFCKFLLIALELVPFKINTHCSSPEWAPSCVCQTLWKNYFIFHRFSLFFYIFTIIHRPYQTALVFIGYDVNGWRGEKSCGEVKSKEWVRMTMVMVLVACKGCKYCGRILWQQWEPMCVGSLEISRYCTVCRDPAVEGKR